MSSARVGNVREEGINLRRGEIQWRRRVHWWKCSLNPLWIQCDSCNATDDSDERGRRVEGGESGPGSSAFETGKEGQGWFLNGRNDEGRHPVGTICDHLFNWFVKVTASKCSWKGTGRRWSCSMNSVSKDWTLIRIVERCVEIRARVDWRSESCE